MHVVDSMSSHLYVFVSCLFERFRPLCSPPAHHAVSDDGAGLARLGKAELGAEVGLAHRQGLAHLFDWMWVARMLARHTMILHSYIPYVTYMGDFLLPECLRPCGPPLACACPEGRCCRWQRSSSRPQSPSWGGRGRPRWKVVVVVDGERVIRL